MKEITKWDNNIREMWVWNKDPDLMSRKLVVYIMDPDYQDETPVCVVDGRAIYRYEHAAEIEEKLMTNKELARWLSLKSDREFRSELGIVSHVFTYLNREEDLEVTSGIMIREGDKPWRLPISLEDK